MSPEISVPQGVPQLAAGNHHSPEDGACLMEYVSVLAGERFSDHPQCVHPTLAGLARVVNDRVSDEKRGDLAVLAPLFIGTAAAGPRVSDSILIRCLDFTDPGRGQERILAHVLRRADRRRSALLRGLEEMRTRRLGVRILLRVAEKRDVDDQDYLRLLKECLQMARQRGQVPLSRPDRCATNSS